MGLESIKDTTSNFRIGFESARLSRKLTNPARKKLKKLDDAIARIAEDTVRDIKRSIKRGELQVADLSHEYAAWKRRNGKDTRILISDGNYVENLTVRKVGPFRYAITSRKRMHRSGIPMERLMRIHEYGTTDGIPERPHIRPALRKAQQRVSDTVRDIDKANGPLELQ